MSEIDIKAAIDRSRDVQDKTFPQVDKRQTVSGEVLRQFVEMLKSGYLRPGDRLPPERDLATMMGISRNSVREALQALNLLGVIESTQGRGTYIAESLQKLPLEPYLFMLLLNQAKLVELIEIRKLIEPAMIELAALRANDAAREDIQERYAEYEWQVQHNANVKAETEAGHNFHLALARAAGNRTLANLMVSVSDLMNLMGTVIVSRKPGTSLKAHRAIKEAVLQGDGARARELASAHLDDIEAQFWASMKHEEGDDNRS